MEELHVPGKLRQVRLQLFSIRAFFPKIYISL
jgi:hypothetical protein